MVEMLKCLHLSPVMAGMTLCCVLYAKLTPNYSTISLDLKVKLSQMLCIFFCFTRASTAFCFRHFVCGRPILNIVPKRILDGL